MRDTELLVAYLQNGSESAFTELVNRYAGLAYSVAQRKLGDRSLAQDVAQIVFCLLLRKAHTLTHHDNLAGWVHRAAYNISLKLFRDERKRRDREYALASMHDSTLPCGSERSWEDLVPLLDEALQQLSDSDRGVLVLRFVQQKGMREVGESIGTTEAAAMMRVGRAVEKVRNYFVKRGLSCSTAALVAALATLSGEAVPVGLWASVAASALTTPTASAGAFWSFISTFIFMVRLKSTLVLIGVGAVAVLMMARFSSMSSTPTQAAGVVSGHVGGVLTLPSRGNSNGLLALRDKMGEKLRQAGLEQAIAKLKAALAAPARQGTRSYPSKALLDAIEAFGAHQDQAFPFLKEALEGSNPEARKQAIGALGMIGKNVPEARPLLWNQLKTGENEDRYMALSSLGNMGILPEEIATLAAMIPEQTNHLLVRYLPETIARAIRQNPEAVKPYLAPVESLLQSADPTLRFSAACALAESRGSQDREILKELAAGLAVSENYRLRKEATGEGLRHLMAVETLQRVGPAAKSVLPELQAFAEATPDALLRKMALRAIATIDTQASATQPEVRSVVTEDQQRNSLWERLQTRTFTAEDLSQGLKEPFTTALAASRLAEMGSAAKSSLPELHLLLNY